MTEHIQNLIDALRDELTQYGEMLALLDRQHQFIMVRAAEEVFDSISPIQAQGEAIQSSRARREKCQRSDREFATIRGREFSPSHPLAAAGLPSVDQGAGG